MMEKSCENCNFKYRCDTGNAYTCQKRNYVNWKLDYLTLESQLTEIKTSLEKANHFNIQCIQEICGLREALQKILSMERMATGTDGVKDNYTKSGKIAKQALSSPAPVDEEKEVLKEALKLVINAFDKYHESNCTYECSECGITYCTVRDIGLAINRARMNDYIGLTDNEF